MRREEILSKGTYVHPQVSDLIGVKQYIILRHKGKKAVLLRLNNERNEMATGVSLRVRQYDVRGQLVGVEEVSLGGLKIEPLADYAMEEPVVISERCVDFKVDIVSASYSDYTYYVAGDEAHITYRKEKVDLRRPINRDALRAKMGGKKQAVSVRSLKAPILMLIACVAVLVAIGAVCAIQLVQYMSSETCFTLDNLNYEFMTDNKEDGPIRLVGYTGYAKNLVIPASIEGYPIGAISKDAFSGTALVSITVEGDTVIEDNAFKNCTKLTSVKFSGKATLGQYAFSGCSKLSSVDLGEGVESLGAYCFNGCTALKSIKLPDSLASIGDGAFADCKNLEALTVPDGVRNIGSFILKNCKKIKTLVVPFIGSTVNEAKTLGYFFADSKNTSVPKVLTDVTVTSDTVIGNGAFKGCSNIESVNYVASVTSIGDNAFSGCKELFNFSIDETVEYIGVSAFENCTSMTVANIPKGIKEIKDASFKGCSRLSILTLPSGLVSIGKDAFNGCVLVKKLAVPSSVVSIGEGAFNNFRSLTELTVPFIGHSANDAKPLIEMFGSDMARSIRRVSVTSSQSVCAGAFRDLRSLETVFLADSILSIGSEAFCGCESLISVDMSEKITSIGDRAFFGCKDLTLIDLPIELTTINESLFEGCTSLYEISIPDSVTEIKPGAFKGCSSLNEIMWADQIEVIGEHAFFGCSNLGAVSIPSSVTEIANGTFENCTELSVVAMPATITRIGDRAFAGCTSMSGIDLPVRLEVLGDCAFAGCTMLRTFTLQLGVEEIGSGVLFGCTSITEITVPYMSATPDDDRKSGCLGYLFDTEGESNDLVPESLSIITLTDSAIVSEGAFSGCEFLNAVVLPTGVQEIEKDAFSGCASLTQMLLPESVDTVGAGAFENCTSLTLVNLSRAIKKIDDRTFAGCESLCEIKLPESITHVGNQAFEGCSSLVRVTMPDGVVSLGQAMFSGCTSLEELTVPFIGISRQEGGSFADLFGETSPASLVSVKVTSAEIIPDHAFDGMTSLKSIELNDEVRMIGREAFAGCTSLESIIIPKSVISIGQYAFMGCDSLTSLTVPFVGTERDNGSGMTSVFGDSVPQSLKKVTVTHTSTIPSNCFLGCAYIEEVVMLSDVESIGDCAFMGCYSLGNIELPETVQTIGREAFYGCIGITKITVPESITSIGEDAFRNCYRLFEVYNLNTDVVEVVRGSGSHGYVGYYAINVYHVDQNSCKTENDGYEFLKSNEDGMWYIVNYVNQPEQVLPDSFDYEGTVIEQYRIPSYLFYQDGEMLSIAMPSAVLEVGRYAFYGCTALTEVNMGDSNVQEIDEYSFYGCVALETVTMPDTVKVIRDSAFGGCVALSEITMSRGLEEIGYRAFYDCSSLTSITLYHNVVSIADDAFIGCDTLYEVFNASILEVTLGGEDNGYVAYNAYIVHNSLYDEKLHDVTIGNLVFKKSDDSWFLVGHNETGDTLDLTSFQYGGKTVNSYIIVARAFQNDGHIVTVNIGNAVEVIGTDAFRDCTALKNVSFANNTTYTSFDDEWFEGCYALETVVFPVSIQSIDCEVFRDYDNLKSVSFAGNVSLATLPLGIFSSCDSLSEIIFPDGLVLMEQGAFYNYRSLENVSFENCRNISVIPAGAFRECYALRSVILPVNIQGIESGAFESCSALESITIPEGVKYVGENAFAYCSELASVSLPTSLKRIDGWAFAYTGIESLTVPGNVDEIGNYAFYSCWALQSADLSAATQLTAISSAMFGYCNQLGSIILPSSITKIGSTSFAGCEKLTSVTLPRRVNTIEYDAFNGCYSLESINIPAGVTAIESNTFANCSALVEITLPNGLLRIGDYAFSGCDALKTVTVPSSVEYIGSGAFYSCSALESVIINSANSIGSYAFEYCEALSSVTLPNNLYSLGYRAFAMCTALESITFPRDLQLIEDQVFEECSALESVDMSGAYSLTSTGSNVFRYCSALTDVTLPNNLSIIGSGAFRGCNALTSIVIPASVSDIYSNAFSDCVSIIEIWNLSEMDIVAGSSSYGEIAINAIVVHDSLSDVALTFDTVEKDGVTFYFAIAQSENTVYLYNIDTALEIYLYELPEYDTDYIVSHHLESMPDCSFIIPTCVVGIHQNTWNRWIYYNVYYCGTYQQWEQMMQSNGIYDYWNVYSYVECKHEYDSTWTYDSEGNVSLERSTFTVTTVKEPTCTQKGQAENSCDECDYVYYTDMETAPHQAGEEGLCVHCGIALMTPEMSEEYLSFDPDYTFELDDEGRWVSNNGGQHSTEAIMTFTATQKMTVTVHYSVSSESGCDNMIITTRYDTLAYISGDSGVMAATVELEAGDYITFNYTKDISVDTYDDCAIIYSIAIVTESVEPQP
ncbi:MAG: hypothetical protein E7649_07175 [Ruminococcaceae bacterium]|nr:hypothetical protein [Oscillospiraceae bacterium]